MAKKFIVSEIGWVSKGGGERDDDAEGFGISLHISNDHDNDLPSDVKIPKGLIVWSPGDATWVSVDEETYRAVKLAGRKGIFYPEGQPMPDTKTIRRGGQLE